MTEHYLEKDGSFSGGWCFSFSTLLICSLVIGCCSATRPSDISSEKAGVYEGTWEDEDHGYTLDEDRIFPPLLYSEDAPSNSDFNTDLDNKFQRLIKGNLKQNFMRFGRGGEPLDRNFLRFGRGKLGTNFIRFGRDHGWPFDEQGPSSSGVSEKRSQGQLNKNFLRFGRSPHDGGPKRFKRLAFLQNPQPPPKKRAIRVRSPRRITGLLDGGKRDALYRNFLRFGKRTSWREKCDGQCPHPITFDTQTANAKVENKQ